jgi:hypothetical protein
MQAALAYLAAQQHLKKKARTVATKLNLSKAARAVGVSRTTIQKYIKNGKLSAEQSPLGSPLVDVAELNRVFGGVKGDGEKRTFEERIEVVTLQHQVEMLKKEVEMKQELLDSDRRLIERLESDLITATHREQQLFEREQKLLDFRPTPLLQRALRLLSSSSSS